MKTSPCWLAVLFIAGFLAVSAQPVSPTTSIEVPTNSLKTSATITLGQLTYSYAPIGPRAPYTLPIGTRIELVPKATGTENTLVTWYKDGHAIGTGIGSRVIESATPADSGNYQALAENAGTASVAVLVTEGAQRLLNVSTRGRIDTNQRTLISGFAVQPGPLATLLLVRAVGPALQAYGVADALAAPQLKVFDAQGREQQVVYQGPVEGVTVYPTPAQAAATVGAFALPGNGKDVARIYLLSGGVYTAQLSSADGGNGTALLEIYEVPLATEPTIYPSPPIISVPVTTAQAGGG